MSFGHADAELLELATIWGSPTIRKTPILSSLNELDPRAVTLVQAYHTCEFLTVTKTGTPIAWPVAGALDPATGTYVISTSVGFPQKAINVRRDSRVALLFSDPTGSELEHAPQLLLQGEATCTDVVESGFVTHAFLWRRLLTIQPPAERSAGFLTRTLMAPYFMRLFISVNPHKAIVKAAHTPSRTMHDKLASTEPLRTVVAELENYTSVVLAAFDASGNPTLVRTTATEENGSLKLSGLESTGLREGRASLLAHRHDERLGDLRSFNSSGELVCDKDGWRFDPDKYIPGQSGGVLASLRFLRDLHRNAATYLKRRNLSRPVVPWNELASLNEEVNGQRPVL